MMKRAMTVMGLLGMGLAAGFVVFVVASVDDRLGASSDDPNCLWPYSTGTLTLEYRWTSSTGSGSTWKEAFEHAVDAWNDQDTNVEWEYNAYGDTSLNAYSADDNQAGFNQPYCSTGSNPVRTANVTWGNSYYGNTTHNRKSIATHELGHAIGLLHNFDSDNGDVMDVTCCVVTTPSSDDVDDVNDIY